ncbi:MAG: hypothetical protein QOE27_633, partial [Solirubrobacteraceae bacterium]|nr:hypothetical protein [Solirubrobacteraceae bacterium]
RAVGSEGRGARFAATPGRGGRGAKGPGRAGAGAEGQFTGRAVWTTASICWLVSESRRVLLNQ